MLIQSLTINGVDFNRMETLCGSGWSDPKGQSNALLTMPHDSENRGRFYLTAQWTELKSNVGYTGVIEARMSDLSVQQLSRPFGDVIVLFGPDGYLELSTSAPPDETGQYNGRIIATTCATSGPGLPHDHWVWENSRAQSMLEDETPVPDMGCSR